MKPPWEFEEPLCAEVGLEFFFPDREENPIDTRFAKSLCAKCIHKTECLEWAIDNEGFGIWGGTNERTRMKMRSKRRIKKSA